MLIIPVIDLYQGQVVHAVRGQRDQYQPVQSRLCQGSDPVQIVQAFLELYPFKTLYIADLNAIRGMGNNTDIINQLTGRFTDLAFWIDNGATGKTNLLSSQQHSTTTVIGSETGINPKQLRGLLATSPEPMLSLDFKQEKFLGDNALLTQPEIWPANVIIMNLTHVGSAEGPDIQLFSKIRTIAPDKNIFSAGGIRNTDDLQRLNKADCAGALMATALHNGQISRQDISALK